MNDCWDRNDAASMNTAHHIFNYLQDRRLDGKPLAIKDMAEIIKAHMQGEWKRWNDQDLYDAYLLGCEDECLPEPLDKGTFLASFEDTVDVQ